MLQEHSEKVRLKSDVEGFLPDDNPWAAPLSPEEEYAVQLLASTQRKTQSEAEYVIRGERFRRRSPKREAGELVIRHGEVAEVLGKFGRPTDTPGADAVAIQFVGGEMMLHVRNDQGIEAWTKQDNVEPLLPFQ